MKKDLNIRFNWLDDLSNEYEDDWRVYSAGVGEEYLFMIGPTRIALSYFHWKGWKSISASPYIKPELMLYNFAVNKMMCIKSRLADPVEDYWIVENIWWQDCVTISAKVLNLN